MTSSLGERLECGGLEDRGYGADGRVCRGPGCSTANACHGDARCPLRTPALQSHLLSPATVAAMAWGHCRMMGASDYLSVLSGWKVPVLAAFLGGWN